MPGAEAQLPLYVDLDGTLVSTDTLDECLLRIVMHRPLMLFLLPFWLWYGKAYFKDRVAAASAHLLSELPFRESVSRYVRECANGGAPIVLATAANYRVAGQVVKQLPLLTDFLASDEHLNLAGENKLAKIREHSASKPFAYVGDGHKDIPIWLAAERAIVVDTGQHLQNQLKAVPEVVVIAVDNKVTAHDWVRQLRCHQWCKNLLLFAALVLAHKVNSSAAVLAALVAFISFSLTASATYIANDLLDLPFDREHPRKGKRPLASGLISIREAAAAAGCLLAIAFGLSLLVLPMNFAWMMLGYMAISFSYSLWLKQAAVLDVMLLAGFYVYRVLIGAVAIQVTISPWLLAFSMFFFLGLGMVKRFSDVLLAAQNDQTTVAGRSYVTADVDFFRSVGTASSCVAVLVLALYLQSQEVTKLYARPHLLWLVCLLVLYWNLRAWFVAQRGEMPDDPILFALRDPVSYVVAVLTFLVLFVAT
jgi:4-hydroxybenzoate polyprenyltransferase/phosphoserine phosphatase